MYTCIFNIFFFFFYCNSYFNLGVGVLKPKEVRVGLLGGGGGRGGWGALKPKVVRVGLLGEDGES